MIENFEEIDVDHFAFDYFKRNDIKKCIEISHSNGFVPVDQFYLYIDHTDCSPMCFVVGNFLFLFNIQFLFILRKFQNGKISKTENQLSDTEKFNVKSDRDKNRYRALVTAKNIQSVYEIYQQLCLTERCLLLPIHRSECKKEVKLHHEQCNAVINITDLLTADCWLQIFSYLDLNDLFQLSAVCSDFRALVQHNKKVKNLKTMHFKFYEKYFDAEGEEIFADKSVTKMTEILECIGDNLEEINLSVGRTSNEIGIFQSLIRNVGSNLHTLRLYNFCWLSMILENLSDKVFDQIKTLCLDSQYYDIPIVVNIKAKFPNLEKLALHGRWKVIDFADWSGIRELTLDRLISLNHVSWMTWITDVSAHFSNLETLNISNTMKRTIDLGSIERLLQLKKLKKIQIEIVNQNCFDILLKMCQLTSVSLIFYSSIQEIIENRLHELACCLPNLQQFELTLKEEAFLPRDDLIQFISAAHQLKYLHLINDTIKIFLFIAPSFLLDILRARKLSQGICNESSLLVVAFSKCFIDENVFKVRCHCSSLEFFDFHCLIFSTGSIWASFSRFRFAEELYASVLSVFIQMINSIITK